MEDPRCKVLLVGVWFICGRGHGGATWFGVWFVMSPTHPSISAQGTRCLGGCKGKASEEEVAAAAEEEEEVVGVVW